MADNLRDNEWNKFSEVNNIPVVDIVIVEGEPGELDEDVRLETLEADKFEQVNGKPVVRVNVIAGATGVDIFELEFFKDTANDTRIGWVPAGTDATLEITHGLKTDNIVVEFYETGLDGAVDVPWTTQGINQITACIPAGTEFDGEIRILSRLASTGGGSSESYSEAFTVAKFIEISNGRYQATFLHGLGSNILNYNFYLDNKCPNLICAFSITGSVLILNVNANERFGGTVIIEKTS